MNEFNQDFENPFEPCSIDELNYAMRMASENIGEDSFLELENQLLNNPQVIRVAIVGRPFYEEEELSDSRLEE